MFLGKLKRSEEIPITLTLDAAPTGTPSFRILKQDHTEHVGSTPINNGSGLKWWHENQNVGGADTVGSYLVEYTAVIDGVTRYAFHSFEVTIYEIDDVKTKVDDLTIDVAAVPTVGEIDTELSVNHGAGLWGGTAGSGAYNATFNVKDDAPDNVADATVTIHNAADDDPVLASGITDPSGNVTLLVDGNIYVRVKKSGFNFTSTAKNVTASGTYNVTGTALTYPGSVDPDLCKLTISADLIGGDNATSKVFHIMTRHKLTKDENGNFISNDIADFTWNSETEKHEFEAVRGVWVEVYEDDVFGLDTDGEPIKHRFQVPNLALCDISDKIYT